MKENRNVWTPTLLVAIALGTAWAVRGKFGHEQGAAWAGAVGAIALVLAAGRKDWYVRLFTIALAAAWAGNGWMSVWIVVGLWPRHFLNVSGLHGCLSGDYGSQGRILALTCGLSKARNQMDLRL